MAGEDPLYKYQSRGLLYSVLGHAFVFVSILFRGLFGGADLGPETVYSVTIEGGSMLGGISQIDSKKNKEKPAPPKPEESKSKPVEEKVEKEVKSKETKPEPEEKDAEVSTKKDPVVTPKPEKKEDPKELEKKKIQEEKEKQKQLEKQKQEEKKKAEQKAKVDLDKEYQKALQRYTGESSDAGGKGFGAARLGGIGMGGGEIRPPEFFTYRDLIKRTVKKNWSWFDTSTSLRATIYFAISADGEISDVSIVKGSGNSLFDNSVLRAVLKSSPLPPPPENVYKWFKEVRTEFDPQE